MSLAFAGFAFAREAEAPAPEATRCDVFWPRSELTGNWGGLRDTLAAYGLSVDFDAGPLRLASGLTVLGVVLVLITIALGGDSSCRRSGGIR